MLAVAQLVERQFVVLDVVGSSPVGHPIIQVSFLTEEGYDSNMMRKVHSESCEMSVEQEVNF